MQLGKNLPRIVDLPDCRRESRGQCLHLLADFFVQNPVNCLLRRGPASLLEGRDTITAQIDLSNRISSHVQEVTVNPSDDLIRPVGPSIVRVSVAIDEPDLPSGPGGS